MPPFSTARPPRPLPPLVARLVRRATPPGRQQPFSRAACRSSHSHSHSHSHSSPPQPHAWPSSATPTPYAILNLDPAVREYSKSASSFSHWVKLYHPDRPARCAAGGAGTATHTDQPPLTPAEKARRLALVLAADKLLSNPAKKRAYDAYGLHWAAVVGLASRPGSGHWSSASSGTPTGTRGQPFTYTGPTLVDEEGPIPRAEAKAVAAVFAVLTLTGLALGIETTIEREERVRAVHARANRHLKRTQAEAAARWARAEQAEQISTRESRGTVPNEDNDFEGARRSDGQGLEVDRKRVLKRMIDEWRDKLKEEL